MFLPTLEFLPTTLLRECFGKRIPTINLNSANVFTKFGIPTNFRIPTSYLVM